MVEPRDVFDIAVSDARSFFANGVLVHNCDEIAAWRYPEAWDQLRFGLRLGLNPRVVVTTTPRPTRIVRELVASPTTYVTRGATYENRANLAAAFIEQILSRYENTRLGRQEIYAEILDDTPGALWQRGQLENLCLPSAPELVRVVVAIDPAVSAEEGSCETGIVVAGVGSDGHGYVLDDLSGTMSPNEWANVAVGAYHARRADRVVAEINNGGVLVETTIRTVDSGVSYYGVHAARGKQARAEPIAALYEQQKVHHVRALPKLEDQMCTWVPGTGKSPDRVDALVWALTELMLGPEDWGDDGGILIGRRSRR